MASTLTAATLTVKLTESVSLNGSDQGSENTLTIPSIARIDRRLVTVTTTEVEIAKFHTTDVAPGRYDEDKVVYMRITNLDDSNHVILIFKNQDNDESAFMIDKGCSFIYGCDLAGGVRATADAVDNGTLTVSLNDLVEIRADAAASTCDLEIFVAETA